MNTDLLYGFTLWIGFAVVVLCSLTAVCAVLVGCYRLILEVLHYAMNETKLFRKVNGI